MGAVSMAPMLLCCGCGYQRALGLVHAAREEREREREKRACPGVGVPEACTGRKRTGLCAVTVTRVVRLATKYEHLRAPKEARGGNDRNQKRPHARCSR